MLEFFNGRPLGSFQQAVKILFGAGHHVRSPALPVERSTDIGDLALPITLHVRRDDWIGMEPLLREN